MTNICIKAIIAETSFLFRLVFQALFTILVSLTQLAILITMAQKQMIARWTCKRIFYAGGRCKTRWARGRVLEHGKLKDCTPIELADMEIYTWSAWATGYSGFGWNIWPELDHYHFSATLRSVGHIYCG